MIAAEITNVWAFLDAAMCPLTVLGLAALAAWVLKEKL